MKNFFDVFGFTTLVFLSALSAPGMALGLDCASTLGANRNEDVSGPAAADRRNATLELFLFIDETNNAFQLDQNEVRRRLHDLIVVRGADANALLFPSLRDTDSNDEELRSLALGLGLPIKVIAEHDGPSKWTQTGPSEEIISIYDFSPMTKFFAVSETLGRSNLILFADEWMTGKHESRLSGIGNVDSISVIGMILGRRNLPLLNILLDYGLKFQTGTGDAAFILKPLAEEIDYALRTGEVNLLSDPYGRYRQLVEMLKYLLNLEATKGNASLRALAAAELESVRRHVVHLRAIPVFERANVIGPEGRRLSGAVMQAVLDLKRELGLDSPTDLFGFIRALVNRAQ